jgi:hypothetical protein
MNVLSSNPEYGGSPHIQECKIIKQLQSLSFYSENLLFIANRLVCLEGRLIRLHGTIYAKDTGVPISEKYAAQAALDYERDIELENECRHGYIIDKATFLEVCKKIYDQKGEA